MRASISVSVPSPLKRGEFQQLRMCLHDSLTQNCFDDWIKAESQAYILAKSKGWLHIINTSFLPHQQGLVIGRTFELPDKGGVHIPRNETGVCKGKVISYGELVDHAKTFNNYNQWARNNRALYKFAHRRGWLNAVSACYPPGKGRVSEFSLNDCLIDAKQYKSISEWKRHSQRVYTKAYQSHWIPTITSLFNEFKLAEGGVKQPNAYTPNPSCDAEVETISNGKVSEFSFDNQSTKETTLTLQEVIPVLKLTLLHAPQYKSYFEWALNNKDIEKELIRHSLIAIIHHEFIRASFESHSDLLFLNDGPAFVEQLKLMKSNHASYEDWERDNSELAETYVSYNLAGFVKAVFT